MTQTNEETIEKYIEETGIKFTKTGPGAWSVFVKHDDEMYMINVGLFRIQDDLPMIQVGCLFLERPEKNREQLFQKLLELQTQTWDAKFSFADNGDVVLIAQRVAHDLDLSEFKTLIYRINQIYTEHHDACLEIVK